MYLELVDASRESEEHRGREREMGRHEGKRRGAKIRREGGGRVLQSGRKGGRRQGSKWRLEGRSGRQYRERRRKCGERCKGCWGEKGERQ